MEGLNECYICKYCIGNANSEIKFISNRSLCLSCYEKYMNIIPKQRVFNLEIKDDVNLPNEACLTHGKNYKLYCFDCKGLACSKCVFLHKSHLISSCEDAAKEFTSSLKDLEYAVLWSLDVLNDSNSEILNSNLDILYTDLLSEYNQLKSANLLKILTDLHNLQTNTYARLVQLNNEFKNIPLKHCKDLCLYGRNLMNLLNYDNYMH